MSSKVEIIRQKVNIMSQNVKIIRSIVTIYPIIMTFISYFNFPSHIYDIITHNFDFFLSHKYDLPWEHCVTKLSFGGNGLPSYVYELAICQIPTSNIVVVEH